MAGRASGRGSENHTRPRNGLAGALCLTAVQGLERGVQLVEAWPHGSEHEAGKVRYDAGHEDGGTPKHIAHEMKRRTVTRTWTQGLANVGARRCRK